MRFVCVIGYSGYRIDRMLNAQRRKRQEVADKVGGGLGQLGPSTSHAMDDPHQRSPQGYGNNGYRDHSAAQPQHGGIAQHEQPPAMYQQQNYHQPEQSRPPLLPQDHASLFPPLRSAEPPSHLVPHSMDERNMNVLPPPALSPGYMQQPPLQPALSDQFGTTREVRSAGHARPVNDYVSPQGGAPSPRGEVMQQAAAPLHGRRARTSELGNRDQAREERQLQYQQEIAAQREELRLRKQQERDRLRQEDEALERRVQDDRMKLANKERMEREQEIREREEKANAALGGAKRRGGNHKPSTPDQSNHQQELQKQIEERKRRKEEDEEAKRLADEQYERRYGGQPSQGGHPPKPEGIPLPWSMPDVGNNPPPSMMPPGPSGSNLYGPSHGAVGNGAPHLMPNMVGAAQPMNGMHGMNSAASPSWLGNDATRQNDAVAQMQRMKDDIFNMLSDQNRLQQQQQLYFPSQAPMAAPYGRFPPTYEAHNTNAFSGGYYNGVPPPPHMQYALMAPQPFHSPSYAPHVQQGWGPHGHEGPSYQMPAYNSASNALGGGGVATQDVLRRFMEDDRAEAAQYGRMGQPTHVPQDDISLELPTEHVEHVGRPPLAGRRR